MSSPSVIRGQIPESLDLTAPVEAENCVPCHTQLGEAKKPGLIFTHGNHIMVSCTACHYRPAHQDGANYTPPMESCFNCHGVAHGPPASLPTSECEECHTPSFDLRPTSHTEDWAAEPHAERAKADTNQCMMCHDAPDDCDACHEDEDVDVGPMPGTFLGIMPGQLEQPAVLVYPQEPTSMGQCIYCHPDIDDFIGGRVIFAHADHLRRNYDCEVCHPQFGHGIEEIRRPDMLSCYRCHGLTHAAAGDVATEDCLACHPPDFELMPPDHTPEFEAGEHKKRALRSRSTARCVTSRSSASSATRADGRAARARRRSSRPTTPKADWLSAARRALSGAGGLVRLVSRLARRASAATRPSCRIRRTGSRTTRRQGMPTARTATCATAIATRARTAITTGEAGRAHRGELHAVPRRDEPEAGDEIQNKGYAEHAVHFKVAEIKGQAVQVLRLPRLVRQSEAAQEVAKLQGHDLRLCYDCHGALDVFDVEIAPYPGKELCIRCHTNIDV